MNVRRLSLEKGARQARGVAVVVDVFRAFTCAPLLFDLGVSELRFVARPEEGLALKRKDPEWILIGEVNGAPIPGYDLGNSPKEILACPPGHFRGRRAVQRTSSGVQGVLIALERATPVLPASFANAAATARHLRRLDPPEVSIIAMGRNMKEPAPEDELCARYLASLLGGSAYDHREAMRELLFSPMTQLFTSGRYPYLPAEDAVYCLQRDLFDHVLCAEKKGDAVIVRPLGAS